VIEPPPSVLAARQQAELLFSHREITKAIDQLSVRLTVLLAENNPLLVCVMNGALPFTAALMQRLHFPLQVTYVDVGRYGNETEGGRLTWHRESVADLRDRHVVLVDDILDRGVTIGALRDWAERAGASAVTVAVLLDKGLLEKGLLEQPERGADFAALKCPDRYVFGWGMDFEGYWRNLPDIYALPHQGEA
jgi:hypoxanthine phosphoribosyltransferase